MNTQAFEQFKVMDKEALSVIEGGYNCTGDFVTGVASGTAGGALAGGPVGAFVGAHVGVIAGGLKCVGGQLSSRYF